MGKILRLTEGTLAPVACLETEENLCPRAENCVTLLFWKKMKDAIDETAEGTTLADLVMWQETEGDDGDQHKDQRHGAHAQEGRC